MKHSDSLLFDLDTVFLLGHKHGKSKIKLFLMN